MVEILDAINSIGSELAGTAGATAKLDFSTAGTYDPNFVRKGVVIANTGSTPIYVKLVDRSASAPTVSATNYHAQIASGAGPLVLRVRRPVDVYINGSGTYTAVEVG